MAYVITEKCLGEQYAACQDVCPVDCIHSTEYQGQPYMVIDPDVCIDCSLCLSECPIGAIVDNPAADPAAAQLNAKLTEEAKRYEQVHPIALRRPPNDPPHRADNHLVK